MKYPYDVFSKIIDLHLLLIKILLAISGMSNKYNLSKLFFIATIIILLFLQIYLTYIILFKSYYLMNNVSLNKLRYSTLLSNCIIILFFLIINTNEVSNVFFIICFINIFILTFILFWIFYDPYQFIKFDKDENEENVFYYFFVLDRDKNENLLLENKINEHIDKCGKCNLCRKYKDANINNKFENVDLYDVIYNNKNSVLSLMNKILRKLKKQKIENMPSNNSYFLINLIYIYYMGIEKNDHCFFLNTELLYHSINNQNENYFEEYKIFLNRIKYINNFIVKSNEIVENFYKIIDEKKEEKKYEIIFNFCNLLNELKYKEIKNNNSNIGNITNKNLNCDNLLTICSLFYEELYNESTSNSRLYIRDSQNILEDLMNNNIKNQKLITFEIIAQNFHVKILRASGYLHKYENINLFDLFPEIFKKNQIISMKKILLTSNSIEHKILKNNKTNTLKNNQNENQYYNFFFIIEEKKENNIYYQLLNLEMNLMILKNIETIFYLNGIYKIDNNIIITEQRNNIEFLFHFGNPEQKQMIEDISKDKKIIIRQNKGNKYLGNKKLIENKNALKGCKHYKVYHFLLPSKKNFYNRKNKHTLNKLMKTFTDDKINTLDNDNILNFNDVASQSSYATSSVSKKNFLLYNRDNKQTQNDGDISRRLLLSKYLLWISIYVLFIAFIIEYAILKVINSNLKTKVNFFLELSNFFLIYNRLFCSIVSNSCLGISPDSQECYSVINNYSRVVKETTAEQNSLDLSGKNIDDYFLDFDKIIFEEEGVLSKMLDGMVESLNDYLSKINDKELLSLFEKDIICYKITQSNDNNITRLTLKEYNLVFIDSILLIASRFRILVKEFDKLKSPIYIMDKIDIENSLINVNKDQKLNVYQENFYLVLLDDDDFFVYFNETLYEIEDMIKNKEAKFKTYILFIFGINTFLYLIILIFLYWYITVHLIIIFKVIKNTYIFLSEKLGEILIKDIMKKKVDNLKLILSFYDNDINGTINELNLLYNNYKWNYSLKLKEESKKVKKEIKNEKDNNKNNCNFFELFNFQYFIIFFTYSKKRNIYIYSLVLAVVIIILLFVIIICIWILFFNKDSYIINWLYLGNELIRSTNDLMANFLIMIYTNQSIIEASAHLDTKDYTSYLYEKLAGLYSAGGYNNKIQDYLKDNENLVKFDCKEFYQNLDNSIFNKLIDRYLILNDTTKFFYTLEAYCNISRIFIFNNYKVTFMTFYNYIENLMENFICGEYSDIVNFTQYNNIGQVEIFFLSIYAYLVEILNEQIKFIFISIVNEIDNNINIMLIIFLICFIYLISRAYILFSRNLNKECQSFIQIKKIFKLCNINE